MRTSDFHLLVMSRFRIKCKGVFELVFYIFILSTSIVRAECVPTPDCAEIGYTESSCDGDSLKCPFDTSKLLCIPCDSMYKHDCQGSNYVGGIGNPCKNKYIDCSCVIGAIKDDGNCICNNQCSVGAIYYSDGTCSDCVFSNKQAIGVIIKDNNIAMALLRTWVYWSYGYSDVTNLTNITTDTNAKSNYTGTNNTTIIVNMFGANADINTNAGVFCYNYAPAGLEELKNRWYLPSAGEFFSYVYKNYEIISSTLVNKLGWGSFTETFWTSNEYDTHYAWQINIANGNVFTKYKYEYSAPTTCFITIQ